MRKRYLLVVTFLLASLALTGCFGGSSTNYVYNGSPTALKVVIKRAGGSIASKSLQATPLGDDHAKVRIWKSNSAGDVIYSVVRQIPISEITSEGYAFSEEVPSDKGYNITAIYTGDGIFEAGESRVNAPADESTITTVTINPLEFIFHQPVEVYSGGATNQFRVEFQELKDDLRYTVYLATAPWTANGENNSPYLQIPVGGSAWTDYTSAVRNRSFPEVFEPTKLYYQLLISSDDPQLKGISWYPDTDRGEELPFVWYYPSP